MSRSERAVFRLPGVALLIPFLLFVCVTPLATVGATFWLALYVLPLVGLAYIVITRTVADAEVIRTTGLLGGRRIAWADLDGLEFHGPRWAIAVGTSGRRFRLPMVRPRDLPRLAQVSGGRLLVGRDAPAEQDTDPAGDPATGGTAHPGTDIAGDPNTDPNTDEAADPTTGGVADPGTDGAVEPTAELQDSAETADSRPGGE